MGLIGYLKSGDSRRSLKKLNKMADAVEALAPKYAAMSDAELKAQTGVLKDRLAKGETWKISSTTPSRLSGRRAAVSSGCAISMCRSSAASVFFRDALPR